MDPVIPEFKAFSKIPRISNLFMSITEKLDGSNGLVYVPEDPALPVLAGSRNRWLAPNTEENRGLDNFGFALWVNQNQETLRLLGAGYHYGEWYGCGIGRGYDLHERRFALFNPDRYKALEWVGLKSSPVGLVPELYRGIADIRNVDYILDELRQGGSRAVPGYARPEGCVIRLGDRLFKALLDKDGPSPLEAA